MAEIKRNAIVVKALCNVTFKTVGIGHKFNDCFNFGAFKGHSSCHDKADVAGAEDENFFTAHIAVHVDIFLGGAGSENSGRSFAGNCDCAAGSFAAAHCENDRACVYFHIAFSGADCINGFFGGDSENHGVGFNFDSGSFKTVDESLCVFRAGKLFFENVKTETGMDALVKNSAKLFVTLDDKNGACSVFLCFFSGGKTCGASADNN